MLWWLVSERPPLRPPSLIGYCSTLCESGGDLLGAAPSNMPWRRTPPRLPTFFLDRLLEVAQVQGDDLRIVE